MTAVPERVQICKLPLQIKFSDGRKFLIVLVVGTVLLCGHVVGAGFLPTVAPNTEKKPVKTLLRPGTSLPGIFSAANPVTPFGCCSMVCPSSLVCGLLSSIPARSNTLRRVTEKTRHSGDFQPNTSAPRFKPSLDENYLI